MIGVILFILLTILITVKMTLEGDTNYDTKTKKDEHKSNTVSYSRPERKYSFKFEKTISKPFRFYDTYEREDGESWRIMTRKGSSFRYILNEKYDERDVISKSTMNKIKESYIKENVSILVDKLYSSRISCLMRQGGTISETKKVKNSDVIVTHKTGRYEPRPKIFVLKSDKFGNRVETRRGEATFLSKKRFGLAEDCERVLPTGLKGLTIESYNAPKDLKSGLGRVEIERVREEDNKTKVLEDFNEAKNSLFEVKKKLKKRRKYEGERELIKENEKGEGGITSTFSLDLHGFEKKEAKEALEIFINIMKNNKIHVFSVIYGKSKGEMYRVSKKRLKKEGDLSLNFRSGQVYAKNKKGIKKERKVRVGKKIWIPFTHLFTVLNIRIIDKKIGPKESISPPFSVRDRYIPIRVSNNI